MPIEDMLFRVLDRLSEGRITRRLSKRLLSDRLKIHGPGVLKKLIWDYEYSRGLWDYMDPSVMLEAQPIAHLVEIHSNNGCILDMGCGTGRLLRELNPTTFTQYTGVDISEIAIESAITRCQDFPLHEGKAEFIVADILEFRPQRDYDVIVFQECLFYLKRDQIVEIVSRYSTHLTQNGAIITRFFNKDRYGWIMDLLREKARECERYLEDESTVILICKLSFLLFFIFQDYWEITNFLQCF